MPHPYNSVFDEGHVCNIHNPLTLVSRACILQTLIVYTLITFIEYTTNVYWFPVAGEGHAHSINNRRTLELRVKR
jgi:hypothetical protein